MYIGKILKDDLSLEESKIENGVTVNLVKAQTAVSGSTGETAAEQKPAATPSMNENPFGAFGSGMGMPPPGFAMPGGMPDPNTISQMMSNPMV